VPDQRALPDGREKIVKMPATIDFGNARAVAEELLAAFDARTAVVIADLTGTSLCTAAGVHELALACERATARKVELRLAISSGEALRVFALTGYDRWLPIYPSVQAALAGRASAEDGHESALLVSRAHAGDCACGRYRGERSRK
jgi:anti-anti-sigma factor